VIYCNFLKFVLFLFLYLFLFVLFSRVPQDSGDKSVIIDGSTYSRLLNACNYKTKDEREYEKEEIHKEKDQIIVYFANFG
jgi:hypothetical protein